MTTVTDLRSQRAALELAEAENDITNLEAVSTALADPSVDTLLALLATAHGNLVDQVRQNNVANLITVLVNTKQIIATNLGEAKRVLAPAPVPAPV